MNRNTPRCPRRVRGEHKRRASCVRRKAWVPEKAAAVGGSGRRWWHDIPTRLHSTPRASSRFSNSHDNRWAAVLPRVVMGFFPFAGTTWSITSLARARSDWVGGPDWRLRLPSSLRLPRLDSIPTLAASRQAPLALRRFTAYIQRVPFSRIPVRSPSAQGLWGAPTIERGPPAARRRGRTRRDTTATATPCKV